MAGKPTARVVCPLCGWHRVVKRIGANASARGKKLTHIKPVFRFGSVPLDKFTLVRWYVSHGHCSDAERAAGKPCGFEEVSASDFEQAVNDPNWSWAVDDIYNRAHEIIRRIDNARSKRSAAA